MCAPPWSPRCSLAAWVSSSSGHTPCSLAPWRSTSPRSAAPRRRRASSTAQATSARAWQASSSAASPTGGAGPPHSTSSPWRRSSRRSSPGHGRSACSAPPADAMFRLVYSNRVEELLVELSLRARAQQRADPIAPVRMVVPSAGVERYVRLGLAREAGIAANLDIALLTRFVADVVASSSGARVADAAALEAMALALLLDAEVLSHVDLAPVRTYLRAGGDDAQVMDVRRVQLAARIGRLFE